MTKTIHEPGEAELLIESVAGQHVVVNPKATGVKIASARVSDSKAQARVITAGTFTAPPPPDPEPEPEPEPPPTGAPWDVPFGTRPKSGKVLINTATDVVIEGKFFDTLGPDVEAIRLENVKRALIRAVDFRNVAQGITLANCEDVTIEWARYENIIGPHARVGKNRANLLQAMYSNRIILRHAKGKGGDTEDIVSIYKTGGSLVEFCHFEGTNWTSPSGSGIALGDDGGSGNIARRNILLNPGQAGIFIAGGQNSKIIDNIICKPAGMRGGSGDIGIYVWNQYAHTCSGHEVSGNRVWWIKADGVPNHYWNAGNCGPTDHDPANIFESIDPNTIRVTL